MNHYRLYENLNVQPFLEEININDDWLLGQNAGRSAPDSADGFGEIIKYYSGKHIDLIESPRNPDDSRNKEAVVASEVFCKYKIASSFLGWFKKTHNAQIARVRYVKTPSGISVGFHIDDSPYYWKHNRFHLVLQGKYQYTVNGEEREYKEGELWWFNNNKLHGTYIHGSKDRIILIFDCDCDMESIINNDNGVTI